MQEEKNEWTCKKAKEGSSACVPAAACTGNVRSRDSSLSRHVRLFQHVYLFEISNLESRARNNSRRAVYLFQSRSLSWLQRFLRLFFFRRERESCLVYGVRGKLEFAGIILNSDAREFLCSFFFVFFEDGG